MLKLGEWNEVLDYADQIEKELTSKGYNVRLHEYSMYDGRKGIYLTLYDNHNKVHQQYASGVHNSIYGKLKRAKMQEKTYGGTIMRDIDIHFKQIEPNKFWLLYNGESFEIFTYNDGKFHNKLYECEKEIPEELEWFVDTVIRRELEME